MSQEIIKKLPENPTLDHLSKVHKNRRISYFDKITTLVESVDELKSLELSRIFIDFDINDLICELKIDSWKMVSFNDIKFIEEITGWKFQDVTPLNTDRYLEPMIQVTFRKTK